MQFIPLHTNFVRGRSFIQAALISASLGLMSACTWVQLSPEAAEVYLRTTSQVSECDRVGTANVNALSQIGFIDRSAARLQDELVDLAKNEAARLGGDSVVPESTIDDGKQTFGVFLCGR
ncbi:DUF4156 domain-containing protein [Pseudohongiella nitratireducens]|jgi:hypothetical protein|nr:DUF4156 domain-containing protein [Pseudohongiella nitratireducens]